MNDNGTEYPHEHPVPENVLFHPARAHMDIDATSILRSAHDRGVVEIVIVGYDAQGKEFFASSMADAGEAIFHLQRGIHKLNNMVDELQADNYTPPTKSGA